MRLFSLAESPGCIVPTLDLVTRSPANDVESPEARLTLLIADASALGRINGGDNQPNISHSNYIASRPPVLLEKCNPGVEP